MPLVVCVEDLQTGRILRCAAAGSAGPVLGVDFRGEVRWGRPGELAVALLEGTDGRLVLRRPPQSPRASLHRGRRRVEVPVGKPVIALAGDELVVADRRLRLHLHGRSWRAFAPVLLAAGLLLAAPSVQAQEPIEVRTEPPAPPPMPPPPVPVDCTDLDSGALEVEVMLGRLDEQQIEQLQICMAQPELREQAGRLLMVQYYAAVDRKRWEALAREFLVEDVTQDPMLAWKYAKVTGRREPLEGIRWVEVALSQAGLFEEGLRQKRILSLHRDRARFALDHHQRTGTPESLELARGCVGDWREQLLLAGEDPALADEALEALAPPPGR